MSHSRIMLAVVAATVASLMSVPAHADPVKCQKSIIKGLAKYKKTYLTAYRKCLDKENLGKIPGPCPDATTLLKINKVGDKVVLKVADNCAPGDTATLGYPATCDLEPGSVGKEGQCATDHSPIATPTDLAECLKCWKEAELSEFIATLYASHGLEVCGGNLGESSPNCSDLDCTTPLPDQRNFGDTSENDCQRGIAKAGIKYLLVREKLLEKCALAGGTSATCNADLTIQDKLQKAEIKKSTLIKKKCGNRQPIASPPFCCKTGQGNQCTAAASRDDCVMNLSGQVQEGKICDTGNCTPQGAPHAITWWGFCPESDTCPGTALTSIDDLIACVDTSANAIVDELMCFQFPANGGADWPCPTDAGSPSGAFL
jgi:hypothetical protein